jgi:hypothetical protein
MIKNLELTNPDSCLNKAADDEMVFVLRAKDPCRPGSHLGMDCYAGCVRAEQGG